MSNSARLITLNVESAGRLDTLLLEALRKQSNTLELSRARLKEVFQTGGIELDNRAVAAAAWIEPGQYTVRITAELEKLQTESARASTQGCFLPVVYQDSGLLVLNKLSGTPSVPLRSEETETAVGAALALDPELAALAPLGRSLLEPGILHRLDTGTSGLLAFARTPEAFNWYKAAWKNHQVKKLYRALAPSPEVHLPWAAHLNLAHDARSSKKMKVVTEQTRSSAIRGKPIKTITHLRSQKTTQNSGFFDLEIEIETGAMHQIRCTLAHLGAPILGDTTYGGSPSQRLWLHAWRLHLPLPQGGELQLECDLPEGWTKCY